MKKLDTLTPEERVAQRELEHARYLRRKASLGIKRAVSKRTVKDASASISENRAIRDAEAASRRQEAAERKVARHQSAIEHERAYKQTPRYKALNLKYQRTFLERHPGYTQWLQDKKKVLQDLDIGQTGA